ncbi:hypothetical protein [Microlunatus parietis]|uniref:Uncharacterized protein n=1 Tax=Microlunatus parietis TaxID=682979 RepID=A0A7Y9I7F9_9ACTN|nr:hypothetical protein [Microlunatus parietis]NYE71679.1 hypothetical protein [Microlunatus parietis]
MNPDILAFIAGQGVYALPMLLGLILIPLRTRGSARVLGLVGCLIMLIGHILNAVWSLAIPWASHELNVSISTLAGLSAVLGLVSAAGLVLVICAVVAGRSGGSPAEAQRPSVPPAPGQYGQPAPYSTTSQYGQPGPPQV